MTQQLIKPEIPATTYVYGDWSRAELHVLGPVSGDQAFCDDLESSDFHRMTMAAALAKPPEQVEDFEREKSKRIIYSFVYSAFTAEVAASYAGQAVGQSAAEMMPIVERILAKYPDLAAWAEDEIYAWFDNEGWFSYLCNARKHEPVPPQIPREINKLRPTHSARVAINQVAQNSIGLLMKMFIAKWAKSHAAMAGLISNPIQTFDAIGFVTPTSTLHQVIPELSALMTTVLTVENPQTGKTMSSIIRADIGTSTLGFKHTKKLPPTVLPRIELASIKDTIDTVTEQARVDGVTSRYMSLTDYGIPMQWVYWKRTTRPNPYAGAVRPIDLVENPDNPFASALTSLGDAPIFGYEQ